MKRHITIEQIFNHGEFIGSIVGTETVNYQIVCEIPILGKSALIYIDSLPSQSLNKIYLQFESLINSIINLDINAKNAIEELIWKDYIQTCEEGDLGIKQQKGENLKTLNMEYFGLHNSVETFNASTLKGVSTTLQNNEQSYFSIWFDCPWRFDLPFGIYFINGVLDKEAQ